MRELSVLEALLHGKARTRTDLSILLGYHQTTTSRVVTQLVERGLIRAESRSTSGSNGGRPSEELSLGPAAGLVVGIELGRSFLSVVLADASGEVLWSDQSEGEREFVATDDTVDEVIALTEAALSQVGADVDDLLSLGVALHDVVSGRGEWITWQRPLSEPFPIRAKLEQRLSRPVVVEDVSRAFAEAEHRHGAARGYPDAVYLFFGSGSVGGGIFVDDRLLKSTSGVCGEIGHIAVEDDGPFCQCGNRGCLETLASHRAIQDALVEMIRQGVPSSLTEPANSDVRAICEAAARGDKASFLVLKRLARYIAKALGSAVSICGSTRILIGGQLRAAGPGFLRDVSEELRQLVIPALMRDITVEYAHLPRSAGALGVALQALELGWLSGRVLERTEVAIG